MSTPRVLLATLSLASCAAVPEAAPTAPLPVALGAAEARTIVIVRVPSPWWAPRFLIRGRFVDAVREYAAIERLEHKSFTFSDDGRFGGVYLWASRADAEAWFTPAWFQRVRDKRGVEPEVVTLDAPFTVAGPASPVGDVVASGRALRGDAAITWGTTAALDPATEDARLSALARGHGLPDGLVRVSFVRGPAVGSVGVVALWRDRASATRFLDASTAGALAAAAGGPLSWTWFEASVLLDNRARSGEASGQP